MQFGGQSEQQLLNAAKTEFEHIQPEIGKNFDKLEVCRTVIMLVGRLTCVN